MSKIQKNPSQIIKNLIFQALTQIGLKDKLKLSLSDIETSHSKDFIYG